jgi:hypothetical protein
MSRRKPLAALAAVSAAVAVAIPASASAAPIAPIAYAPPPLLCQSLVLQLQTAQAVGNPLLADLLGQTLMDIGCGGAAI